MRHHPAALAAALSVAASAGTAFAGVLGGGENLVNASAICQPALPAFEGVFRKRPLALQNEGASSGFVSCSMLAPSGYGGNAGTLGGSIYAINNTATAKTVDCTFVVGAAGKTPLYVTASVALAANGKDYVRVDAEKGTAFSAYDTINASCSLPPGTGLAETYVWWRL